MDDYDEVDGETWGRPPLTAAETHRLFNISFQKYREVGASYYQWQPVQNAHLPTEEEWMTFEPFPNLGVADPREYPATKEWGRHAFYDIYRRFPLFFDTEAEPDIWDPDYTDALRERYADAKTYFETEQNNRFKVITSLMYGTAGLVLKVEHEVDGIRRNLAIKIDKRYWESREIRDEQRNLRRLARAAHCIQMVDPEELGLQRQRPIPFDEIEDDLDSDSAASSGSESPADEPPPPRRSRRDWLVKNEADMSLKAEDVRARYEARKRAHEDRQEIAFTWVPDPNVEDPDPFDLYHKDYIIFDYLEHGDLGQFIVRMDAQKENAPNRVLWSFWLCLVKACIALHYPPRKFHPRRHERPDDDDVTRLAASAARLNLSREGVTKGKVVGNDLFEEVPVLTRRWAAERIVHFDINPTNILIGGLDPLAEDGEHAIVPRLRLADFGDASKIKRNKANLYYINKRIRGHYNYYAPEQFGIEWEYITPNGWMGPEVSEQRVAGAYGSPMNVWGIGVTMWQIMTKLHLPSPPQRSNLLDVDEPLHYCTLLLDDPAYNHIDLELRQTIARCMRHYPDHRPTLVDLVEQAERAATRQFPGETDDFISSWIHKVSLRRSCTCT
ncbi:kinase-like domain-containing protein [Hypoxylon crocopeplum]|nr:kinase-like domain-containing protein [Hypoxylon crocopeplum]